MVTFNTFKVGDVRTYHSIKKTIEIVRIVKIENPIVYAQRLNVKTFEFEDAVIQLSTDSQWITLISTPDRRWGVTKWLQRRVNKLFKRKK